MAVRLIGGGRTREVTGSIYIERWIQIDSALTQIYGDPDASPPLLGDLNTLDALADSTTSSSGGRLWLGGASPAEYDPGITDKAWYGQAIRIEFKRLQSSGDWTALQAAAKSLVETAFPGELIYEANRRFNRPLPSDDPANPAKYVIWVVEYDNKGVTQ